MSVRDVGSCDIISFSFVFSLEMYALLLPVTMPNAKSAFPDKKDAFLIFLILFITLYSASVVIKLKYSERTLRSVFMVNESEPVFTFIPKVERAEYVYCKSRIIQGH